MTYFRKVWTWFDQGINVIFLAGYPDETVSSRAYRWHMHNIRHWPYKLINLMFFWMKDHCKSAFMNEMKRKQMPMEYK